MQTNQTYVINPAVQGQRTDTQPVHGVYAHKTEATNLTQAGAYQQTLPPAPVYGAQAPAYGSNYGPQATTTTTTVVKETDQFQHNTAPVMAPPMMNAPMTTSYNTYDHHDTHHDKHQDKLDKKHDKELKKERKLQEKQHKKDMKAAKKGHSTKATNVEQVIVPPGPAIVPAVVIPVVGMMPSNSGFYQQQGYAGGAPIQAPTSGVLPPTGVQNPMTATLPINQQGLNPTSHIDRYNVSAQQTLVSTPECNAQCTKEMIGHQHPITGPISGNTSYTTYNSQPIAEPMVKHTHYEEHKEVIGGPAAVNRQF